MKKRCLVVSYGPVPTPEHQTVEGGGMRAWGLAKGLLANGVETTVAINSGFKNTIQEHDGINLVNWSLDADFIRMINSFDAVIVSYCMGDVSVFIADNLHDDVQLILDAYVPIYIEVSARDAKDMDVEYSNYIADLRRHNHTLMRGDYFLYANPAQEKFYNGVLSALGIINPHSYHTNRLIYAPFGIHRDSIESSENPYKELGIVKSDFVVLWFGGIYPWFRIEEYLDAIKKLSSNDAFKFVFVGGKNPFNANEDIARQYKQTVDFAKTNKLTEKSVFFVDWVNFDTRIDWFRNADVIVSLNQPGRENAYSWRTRVMDFVWAEAATITNGGDPLSEEMVSINGALKIDSLSSEAIVAAIKNLHDTPVKLQTIRKNVQKLKTTYFWDIVTSSIKDAIESSDHPYQRELSLRRRAGLGGHSGNTTRATDSGSKLARIASLPIKVMRKVKQKGIKSTLGVAVDIVRAQSRSIAAKREPQFVFISHPIDNTGAPIVLLQIIREYVEKYGASRVRVIAPGGTKNQLDYLMSLGVRVEKAVHAANFHIIRLQLNLRPNDFVLINTIAVYDNYRDFVLLWLRLGRLKHAYWFIHEDKDQIPVINKDFLKSANLQSIKSLVETRKISLIYPSKRTAKEYGDIIGAPGSAVRLRVEIPEEYKKVRSENDFNSINILLSGTSSDGRKGQVLALSALQDFISRFYDKNPSQYRKVHLNLVAIGKDDYISKQVRWISSSVLKEYVSVYDSMPKEKALSLARKCNVVMCCSLNETFGLYIAEGMLMGHIVLRNKSAGVEEQLKDGVNGILIDHTNIRNVSDAIEKLANKENSNTKLLSMSFKSQEMMGLHSKSKYIDQITNL